MADVVPLTKQALQLNPGTKVMGSPWASKPRGRSGTEITELFPNIAEKADDLCVIRSLRGDHSDHFRWLTLKGAAYRADFEGTTDRCLQASPERHVESNVARLHRDRGEAGFTQDAPDPLFARKGERAWVVRPNIRQAGNMFVCLLQRNHHPWVLPRLAPAGEHQATACPQCFPHVGE